MQQILKIETETLLKDMLVEHCLPQINLMVKLN